MKRDASGRFGATHGHTSKTLGRTSPEYRSWNAMRMRCKNPNRKYYTQRGITVCPEWDSFAQFLSDMGPRPRGMSLDRIDPAKGYSKKNCRWATPKQQQQNTSGNVNITYRGETRCVAEWARLLSYDVQRIYQRLRRGWSVERTLETPTRKISW